MLDRILKIGKLIVYGSLVFFLTALGFLTIQARHTLQEADKVLAAIPAVLDNTNTTLAEARAAITQIKTLTGDASTLAKSENAMLESQNKRVLDILDQTETAIINAQIVMDDVNQNSAKVTDKTIATMEALKPALENASIAMKNAGDLLGDPKLKETAAHIEVATQNVATLTASASHSVDLIDKRITQMMKPMSLTKRLFGVVFDGFTHAGAARQALQK